MFLMRVNFRFYGTVLTSRKMFPLFIYIYMYNLWRFHSTRPFMHMPILNLRNLHVSELWWRIHKLHQIFWEKKKELGHFPIQIPEATVQPNETMCCSPEYFISFVVKGMALSEKSMSGHLSTPSLFHFRMSIRFPEYHASWSIMTWEKLPFIIILPNTIKDLCKVWNIDSSGSDC